MAALAVLVLAALAGLQAFSPDLGAELERRLRADIGEVERLAVQVDRGEGLGALAEVDVEVAGVDARRLPLAVMVPVPRPRAPKGRIGRLRLRAERVHLDDLRATEVVFEARDLAYDLLSSVRAGELRVASMGEQTLVVTLADGDLNTYAAVQYPELQDPRVSFEDGRVTIRAKVPLLFAAFDARVTGDLAIEEGRRLMMRDVEIDTGRLELSESMRTDIEQRLNPILDLQESLGFPVPVAWTRLEVGDGVVRLFGEVEEQPAVEPSTDFRPRERYLRD